MKTLLLSLAVLIVAALSLLVYTQYKPLPFQDPVDLVFIDAETKQPLGNKKFTIQHILFCEPGEECPFPIAFRGKTNEQGRVWVSRDVLLMKNTNGVLEPRGIVVLDDRTYTFGIIQEYEYTKKNITVVFPIRQY